MLVSVLFCCLLSYKGLNIGGNTFTKLKIKATVFLNSIVFLLYIDTKLKKPIVSRFSKFVLENGEEF